MSSSDFGPVWKQKIRTLQTRLDLNKDGQVTWEDFQGIANRFVTVGGATVEQGEKIEMILQKMYNKYLADTIANGPLTADAYVEALMEQGKTAISKTVFEIYTPFFDVIDTNNDGQISKKEYRVYYKVLGLDAHYADKSFKDVDKDENGLISRAEYMAAVDDFFCSENPSNFWGPLVK